ncbi:hypothetical protein SAMN04488144_101137 [Methylobacterium sp. 190mf]|uniref:DUF6894 family protein n=1 Tax=Methylobacterium sp. 190mf TaxID=1761798 RepID=UPI00089F478D|nr:hypothetical protein [Methylobacterium sp. 190mf]SEF40919.1 hypothetical protein SAMN04488144_101137 [Methylobacterium sp. 190mf]
MSRYFINTANGSEVMDEEGIDLPSLDALRTLLRRALTEMMCDEATAIGVNKYTARAYDEAGRLVMSAQANFSITDR